MRQAMTRFWRDETAAVRNDYGFLTAFASFAAVLTLHDAGVSFDMGNMLDTAVTYLRAELVTV